MGTTEIIFIAVVILVLFGGAKLPGLARSVGRSLRIFKSEINELKAEDEARQKQVIQADTVETVTPNDNQDTQTVTKTTVIKAEDK